MQQQILYNRRRHFTHIICVISLTNVTRIQTKDFWHSFRIYWWQ